ncbi:unnamed protein product [marine sediment metagenome]|uniref:Uncharacterized protein n=1 Tax=marine sediment metagenome TaxID=412755 RepID=X1CYT4_9ZZZZ
MESEPNLDFKSINTVGNSALLGNFLPNVMTYASMPPMTPAGLFGLNSNKEWPWFEWCKLYVINASTTRTINCIGFAYTMAYLTEPRRTTLLDVERLELYQELYPSLKPEIEAALKSIAKRQVDEVTKK